MFFNFLYYIIKVMNEIINYLLNKIKLIKSFLEKEDIFLIILIIFVSISSFGLGRLSKIDENSQTIQIKKEILIDKSKNNQIEGEYLASKNGSKFYLPWCSGAEKISEKNKIWFKTKEEALNRGYLPAKNCKGI